ncbi:YajQ family cyclic di-GMP-binding protein [Faucicola boevrei]|uniref:YajQ family cyclic di-GMP-binding protein n=1 Tax=Faucicola boevrei TaxID=346665 RepID=UPI000373647F|nr:YajQ family cyclic di-GMP-binding protein [Moraxella boevrei]
MPSFDVVSELQTFEVKHAVQNTEKEIATRFDFKGSDIKVELNEKAKTITISCDNDLQMENVYAMLEKNLIKRGVDLQSLDPKENQGSGKQIKKVIDLKDGLDGDTAKKISKALKESDLKVSASIQGDKIRVNDKKKDNLQLAMAFLKEKQFGVPLQFNNFKD